MNRFADRAAETLAAVRENRPLIHNITNFVVMNYTANALLAMGASPVMAHGINEVEEMAALAGALVLNIGTLTEEWVAAMIRAGKKASELGKPVVLDPVGAGATRLRTASAKQIIEQVRVRTVRGNASEILALETRDATTRGVDSVHSVEDVAGTGSAMADALKTTLAITGPTDFITDGNRVLRVANGHPLMARITGTGCTATAIVGAFSAIDDDPVCAAASALAFFGLAGEVAAQHASAPGSCMIQLLDALYTVTPEDLKAGARIREAR
ncbi:hydroxyethylthiazole kinase [Desulfonema ishimotonii]|uniref:Hydroxyethylthiazole kinase n=1 Tax=Desulfonema ishimotonii TaxID=45657 RepID=A0A401G3R1_9BACT|nr:hydroxyethylthiazole kinase [Desulfonema ishimotonii]GBC63882.1 hydroxyethylthiazole kinase [Desulfonema ishimotonii]